jgi:hypothetical protein
MALKITAASDDDPRSPMLHQRDNFRFGQREYFRFFRLRYGFLKKEAGLDAKGFNHVEPGRA